MITHDNILEVLKLLNKDQKNRIYKNFKTLKKDYCTLEMHCFNSGAYVEIHLTNDFNRYKNISNKGGAILDIIKVRDLLYYHNI